MEEEEEETIYTEICELRSRWWANWCMELRHIYANWPPEPEHDYANWPPVPEPEHIYVNIFKKPIPWWKKLYYKLKRRYSI